jgi:hypothetical protein
MGRVALAVVCRLPTLRNETSRLRWNVSLATRDLARRLPMPKERKTADQLSDMIVSAMGIKGVYIDAYISMFAKTMLRLAADRDFVSRRFDRLPKAG